METLLGVCSGVGLSAACGFRVFVPMLMVSAGVHYGYIQPYEGHAWVGSTPALLAFGVATLVELLGYMIPWVDHMLDTMAVPLAIAAGTVVMVGTMEGCHPVLKWSVATAAGGGVAGTRISLAGVRLGLTTVSGGIANPLLSIAEAVASVFAVVMAFILPVMLVLVLAAVWFFVGRKLKRIMARMRARQTKRTTAKAGLDPLGG